MNKRTFLKLFSAMTAGPVVSPLLAWAAGGKLKNWAGNLEYGTDNLYSARSLEQVREFVKKQSKLKVLGTRHCFNDIADSTQSFLSLRSMDKVVALDPEAHTVTVDAGMSYGQLCPYLHEKGFALHNLASLPHISIAGACSTATHGSGEKNGNLATAVTALEIVTAAGDVVTLSRQQDAEAFRGAVVGLGALGVVTKVTLEIQPSFVMRQYVYENLPLRQPVYGLARTASQRGLDQEPHGGRTGLRRAAGILRGEAGNPESSPHRRALRRELHRADGGAGPLV
jgi:xylitol oxidase